MQAAPLKQFATHVNLQPKGIKMQEKNVLRMKKLFVGLCAVSMLYSLCVTPFVARNSIKATIAGATGAMLGGIGMGMAFDDMLKGKKERD